MPRDEFFGLLAERLAGALGMRRVAIRVMDESSGRTIRLGSYGPPLTNLPDETSIDESPLALEVSRPAKAVVEDLNASSVPVAETINVNSLLIAPIRLGDRFTGVIVADRNGEPFRLDEGELDLAQAMANVAALALDSARTRQAAAVS
jgi:GAF domain-containing protein